MLISAKFSTFNTRLSTLRPRLFDIANPLLNIVGHLLNVAVSLLNIAGRLFNISRQLSTSMACLFDINDRLLNVAVSILNITVHLLNVAAGLFDIAGRLLNIAARLFDVRRRLSTSMARLFDINDCLLNVAAGLFDIAGCLLNIAARLFDVRRRLSTSMARLFDLRGCLSTLRHRLFDMSRRLSTLRSPLFDNARCLFDHAGRLFDVAPRLFKPNSYKFYPSVLVFCLIFILNAYAQTPNTQHLRPGIWHAQLQLNDSTILPFNFEIKEKTIEIINAEERITVNEISYSNDSVFISMPVFDSEFRCLIKDDSLLGNFLNHARTANNVIPFKAFYLSHSSKEKNNAENPPSGGRGAFQGKWEVEFKDDEPPLNKAIGEFKQKGNHLTGTFLTPTGDYRFLEGYCDSNKMYLAAFDGSHVFYFNAVMNKDGTLNGNFYSGKHWHDIWKAFRNENASLPNPDSLTFLKPGYDKLDFTFPDIDSNLVSLSDKKFQNKVVVVQIMGTWCPNCMDETKYLAPFYKLNHDKGLEIIGLDYEKIVQFSTARHNLQRLKKQFQIDYTLLFAGTADKSIGSKTLPQLNRVIAFPTLIIIDKKGRVRNIHTGFSGPATGIHYERWKEHFENFINKLLKE